MNKFLRSVDGTLVFRIHGRRLGAVKDPGELLEIGQWSDHPVLAGCMSIGLGHPRLEE